jgi:hypothetical protein
MAVMAGTIEALEPLIGRSNLSRDDVGVLAMLRNTMPDRVVELAQLRAVFVYVSDETFQSQLAAVVTAGLVDTLDSDRLRLSTRGAEVVGQISAVAMPVPSTLWHGHEDAVAIAAPLTERAVEEATATGGPAFSVLAPPYEPPDMPLAALVAERLTALRFHRFDAHVAAWQAAGLTVDEIRHLEAGPVRDAIEADTNDRAGRPYAALAAHERRLLVAQLARLPG